MNNIILVPLHLDALCLKEGMQVVEPMVNFERLPWSDGRRDYNSDVPYVSDEIQSSPFQNKNLFLQAGVHLHWSMPDALTNVRVSGGSSSYPAVPNRWLIFRKRKGEIEQEWDSGKRLSIR